MNHQHQKEARLPVKLVTEYVLKICDRHEFEHPIFEFRSSTPFGTIGKGDYIKSKDTEEGHPGQAFTHRITDIYHYVYPQGTTLVHMTKLIVDKAKDPNGL